MLFVVARDIADSPTTYWVEVFFGRQMWERPERALNNLRYQN